MRAPSPGAIFPRMTYEVQKRIVLVLLALYFCIGLYDNYFYGNERYPVFSWSLFSSIPNEKTTYTVAISRLGVNTYQPPLRFDESRHLFELLGQSPTQYTPMIENMGMALDRGDTERFTREKEHFERMFGNAAFSYDLLRVRYDPLEYWQYQTFISTTSLGVFTRPL